MSNPKTVKAASDNMYDWKLGDVIVDNEGSPIELKGCMIINRGYAHANEYGVQIFRKGITADHKVTLSLEELKALYEKYVK